MTQYKNKTTRKSALITALLVASLTSTASAYDLYVDDDSKQYTNPDYATIQEAVDNALPGCVIHVYSGTYTASGTDAVVQIQTHDLELIAVGDVVIDGEGLRRCVRATGPTDNRAPIRFNNFTFANGDAGDGNGGGIHATGRVFLDLCKIVDCTANKGGGIAVAPQAGAPATENSYMHMNLTLVRRCSAGQDGGGIFLKGDSSMMTESCWIMDNNASRNGGGIAAIGGSTYGSLQILNYDCVSDPADLLQGQLLQNGTISENSASRSGGGIYVNGHTTYLMEGSVLNNRAGESGGGLSVNNATLHMGWYGLVLIGQNAAGEAPGTFSGDGGGLYAESSIILSDIFSDSTFADTNPVVFLENIAYGDGGGVYAKNCEQIDLEKTTFERNRAYVEGGGMLVDACEDFELKASKFLFNVGGLGGALLIQDDGSGSYNIEGSVLRRNVGLINGSPDGGALVLSGSGASAVVTNCFFKKNLKLHIMEVAGADLIDGGMNIFN
jgi:predicted outer membrane repeat protein